MAYPGPVSATQYYQTLGKQPELCHQFYAESSSMVRVDGESTVTASDMMQIHNLVSSLQFTGIEIKTINSLESWNGGVLVVVSGFIRAEYFSGRRSYVETFLLAPQDKGFFVLNDIFNFIEEDVSQQQPVLSENRIDSQLPASTHHQEMSGYAHNHYDYEAEASDYVNSVHIDGDDQIDGYGIEERQEQLQQQPQETYTELEDIPTKEASPLHENSMEPVQEPQYSVDEPVREPQYSFDEPVREPQYSFDEPVREPQYSVKEPVREPSKFTYASILQASKGPSAAMVIPRPYHTKSTAPQPERQQPPSPQQPIVTTQTSYEATYENPSLEEVELLKSVYVRNLPSNVTASDIEQEFKTFGKIIPNGVFVKNKTEIGVCFAFVEFEDLQAVHNAIKFIIWGDFVSRVDEKSKASPLQLAGRQIYVEERRANNSGGAPRGGRSGRGRGRGGYQPDSYRGQYGGRSSGRGGYQDGGDYTRNRGNGFRG